MIKDRNKNFAVIMLLMTAVLACAFFISFLVGRFSISPRMVMDIILSHAGLSDIAPYWDPNMEIAVMNVRLPRIIIAILAGGALAVSGASYQTLFKNPMAAPDILGVSAGAGFGAALAMINDCSWVQTELLAFAFGLAAVAAAYFIGNIFSDRSITVLILAGVVVSSFFQALLSIIKTMADTDSELPAITFWLMGSLSRAHLDDVARTAPVIAACMLIIFLFRHRIDVMSAGEDEARSMGINVNLMKAVIVGCSTMMTVMTVSICGIIGWVGMVVPHIARMITGASYSRLIPVSFISGGIFLLMIDDIVRGVDGMNLPIGVMTALFGTPLFVAILAKGRSGW